MRRRRFAAWTLMLAVTAGPSTAGSAEPAPGPSAFSAAVADRDDPYGPRPPGIARLTREQITRYALENPMIQAAKAQVEALEAQVKKARFAWIPVIETTTALSPGVHVQCDDIPVTTAAGGPPIDFQWCRTPVGSRNVDVQTVAGYFDQLGQAGVRISFQADLIAPLYTFGKIKNARKIAQAGKVLAELNKLAVEQETLVLVHRAHTALLLARESIRILEEAHGVAKDARARVEKDLGPDDFDADPDGEAGASERDYVDRYKIELAELELEDRMAQARKIEALALGGLWALAGAAAPRGFDAAERELVVDAIAGGFQRLAYYAELAAAERPEAKMAAGQVAARKAMAKLARSNFLPDLVLTLTGAVARSTSADQGMTALYYQDNYNYSRILAALALRWRLDFHNKAFDLQRARAEVRQSELQLEAARLLLRRDVEQAYQEMVEARKSMDIRHRKSTKAWQWVVAEQQRDTVGTGDSGALVRALERWYEDRFAYFEAIQLHNDALARLSRAVGRRLSVASTRG